MMTANPYSIVPAVLPNDPLAFFDTYEVVAPAEAAAKKRCRRRSLPFSTYSHSYARKTMALKRQFLAPVQEDPLPARMVRRIQYRAAGGQRLFDVARDTDTSKGTHAHEEDALIVTKTLTVPIIPPRPPPRGVVDTALDALPTLRNSLHWDDDLPRVDLLATASVDHDSGIPLEYFDQPAPDGVTVEPVLSVSTPWVARPIPLPCRCTSMTKAPQPSVWDVLVEAA